jgi:hypothetical protein
MMGPFAACRQIEAGRKPHKHRTAGKSHIDRASNNCHDSGGRDHSGCNIFWDVIAIIALANSEGVSVRHKDNSFSIFCPSQTVVIRVKCIACIAFYSSRCEPLAKPHIEAIAISDVFLFNFQPKCSSYEPHKHEIQTSSLCPWDCEPQTPKIACCFEPLHLGLACLPVSL